MLGVRVRKICDHRKVDPCVHVAERVHLEPLEQRPSTFDRRDDRGNDHHGACRLGDAAAQIQSRQQPRLGEAVDGPVHERRGELARGNDREYPAQNPIHGGAFAAAAVARAAATPSPVTNASAPR